MKFECQYCRAEVETEDKNRGKRAICPNCGMHQIVPTKIDEFIDFLTNPTFKVTKDQVKNFQISEYDIDLGLLFKFWPAFAGLLFLFCFLVLPNYLEERKKAKEAEKEAKIKQVINFLNYYNSLPFEKQVELHLRYGKASKGVNK